MERGDGKRGGFQREKRKVMIIGILSVKNHRYHPNRRLLEAAKALNHQGILLHPKKMFMGVNDSGLRIDHLMGPTRPEIILPRLGSTIKEYALTMVRHFELQGIKVVNNFDAILQARNKFLTLQTLVRSRIPIPETGYASNWENFKMAASKMGGFPLVIKTLNSRQGRGVFLLDSMEAGRDQLNGLLDRAEGILIQRFIPPEGRRDIRIVVVGKKLIGPMSLTPKAGDFRANIHLNSKAEKVRLTGQMADLAVRSTRALGLDISGVDMIEEESGLLRVIDVNYSPGFKGLETCTGIDVASEIIKYVARLRKGRNADCLPNG